jgi:hypothetical protein
MMMEDTPGPAGGNPIGPPIAEELTEESAQSPTTYVYIIRGQLPHIVFADHRTLLDFYTSLIRARAEGVAGVVADQILDALSAQP